jgi:hypothetical protein
MVHPTKWILMEVWKEGEKHSNSKYDALYMSKLVHNEFRPRDADLAPDLARANLLFLPTTYVAIVSSVCSTNRARWSTRCF